MRQYSEIMKIQLITVSLLSTLLLAGCGKGVSANTSAGGETSEVKISSSGVQVTTSGEEGDSKVVVSGKGVTVDTSASASEAGQKTTIHITEGGVEIDAKGEGSVTIGDNVKIGGATVEVAQDDGKTIIITGMSEDRNIDGEGRKVVISGASNDVNVTGNCLDLVVSGSSNDVIVEASDKIVVSGTNNDIIYKSGSPKIVNTGVNNTVVKGE